MKVKFGARSDVGLTRQFNEDCYLVDEALGLFIVADGMGGSAGGEIASRMACDHIHEHVRRNIDVVKRFESGDQGVSLADVSGLLTTGIQVACAAVNAEATAKRELAGMGTTVVATLTAGEHLAVAHVGDSRAYLLRNDQLHQLTRDHSLVEELKKLGKIANKDQVKVKFRNAITRAVGIYESVQADVLDLVPLPGDRFLLCTDGMYGTTLPEELQRLLSGPDTDEIPDRLIRHANSRGGKDNITALVLDILETEPEKAELTQRKLATLKEVPLFRYLGFDEMLKVVSVIRDQRFEAGQVIVDEGDAGTSMFVLMTGEVEVTRKGQHISTLRNGDHFGELSLIDRSPRSATVTAKQQCTCLVMGQQQFYDIVREYNALSVKLLWSMSRVLAERLRQTTDELGLARSLIAKVRLQDETPPPFNNIDSKE